MEYITSFNLYKLIKDLPSKVHMVFWVVFIFRKRKANGKKKLKIVGAKRMRFFASESWKISTKHRKNMQGTGEPFCHHYKDGVEIVLHVIRDCPLALHFWNHLVLFMLTSRISFFDGDLKHWLELNLVEEVRYPSHFRWNSSWATMLAFVELL